MLLPHNATLEAVDPSAPATQAQLCAGTAKPTDYWEEFQIQRALEKRASDFDKRKDPDHGSQDAD